MARYLKVVTTDGDRWDLIAARCYGDPWAFAPIIRANPDVPIRPVLPGGLTILVPIVEPPATGGAPPWKGAPTEGGGS